MKFSLFSFCQWSISNVPLWLATTDLGFGEWGSNRTSTGGMSKRGNAATDLGTSTLNKVRNTFHLTFLVGYYCLQIVNGPPGFSTLQKQKLEKQLVILPPLPILASQILGSSY
jgi:hypothetical protein